MESAGSKGLRQCLKFGGFTDWALIERGAFSLAARPFGDYVGWWTLSGLREMSDLSNRPVGVKRFQAIHHNGVEVARGYSLLFGIGTKVLVLGF